MYKDFTDQARNIMASAEHEARQMNHEYVGTEHILLALVDENSGIAADVLHSLGVESSNVRREIENLVERGSDAITLKVLPLTPRAKQAIEFAGEEARYWSQKQVGAEHLLLGLMREPDGVAGQALRNLGLKPNKVGRKVFRIRILQMKIVERAVRPVRAGTPRKRKMREELLAHLTATYDEELARLHNPDAALEEAARRFGDPAELSRELEAALPYHEGISHFVERWFAWRAPETAARFSLRLARQSFYVLAVVPGLVCASEFFRFGWIEEERLLWRVFAAVLLVAPVAQFVVSVLYFKMRDAMWGVFGSRKSLFHAFMFDMLIALAVTGSIVGLIGVAVWDRTKAMQSLEICGIAGLAAAMIWLILARFSGPAEIRDTVWALLDIHGAAPGNSGPRRGDGSAVEPA